MVILNVMATEEDRSLVDDLSYGECLRLLATGAVGRVAFTADALPQVLPVSYAMDGGAVVLRTTANGRLAIACTNAVVAFEVDNYGTAGTQGWYVVVVGRAQALESASDIIRAQALSFSAGPSGMDDQFIRIAPGVVTGKQLPASSECGVQSAAI